MESNDVTRKMNLENMSNEELIKKCSQLLQLAQKAKQAKSTLQEENNKLKEELNNKNSINSDPVLQELIENLTQQKLSLVTNNQELKAQNIVILNKIAVAEEELNQCRHKLNICDNENTSYKRQIDRLTDENEQLILDLDALEKAKNEENEKIKTELQLMLTVSLDEVKKLKNENSNLLNKVENLQLNLSEKDKSIIVISEELTAIKNSCNSDIKELETLKSYREYSEQQIKELNDNLKRLEDNNQEFKESQVKLKQKLKFYHSKIVKFAGIAKELRQDKTELLDLFKSYLDQVKDWKDQLNSGEKNIVKYLNSIEMENQHLRQKLEEQNQTSQHDLDSSNLENEIKILTDKYECEKVCLQKELGETQTKLETELKLANENIQKLMMEIEDLKQSNVDNKIVDEKEKLLNDLRDIQSKYDEEKADLLKKVEEIQNIKESFEKENLTLQEKVTNSDETIKHMSVEIQALKQAVHETQMTELKEAQQHFEEERTVLINKLDDIQNTKDRLQSESTGFEQKLKESMKAINDLNVEIENLRQNKMDSNKILNEKQIIEKELKEIQIKYEEERTSMHQKLEEMDKKNINLLNELENYKTENIKSKENEGNILQEIEGLRQKENDINNLLKEKEVVENELKTNQMKHEAERIDFCNKLEDVEGRNVGLLKELDNLKAESLKTKQAEDNIIKEQENEIKLLRKENVTIAKIKDDLLGELDKLNFEKRSMKEKSEMFNSKTQERLQECENTILGLQNQVRSLEELEMRSTEEIKNLADHNKELIRENEMLNEKLQSFEYSLSNRSHTFTQTNEVPYNSDEYEEQIANLKRENTELLSEMNEMNQAIKERGENISKLEAHCEEVLKKLQIYETQANKNIDNLTEKEKIIENLTNEIQELKNNSRAATNNEMDALRSEVEALKEKLNANIDASYPDNDTMSTSTISRTDDVNRLKDLEGSWEEKYGKLRNLAIKLKGKVRELTQTVAQQQSENEEAQKKLATNIKTIQNLQNQCDRLEDDLEKGKKESKQLQNQLNAAANDISRDKKRLADKEEELSKLMIELENNKKEKQATEVWKKQVGAKIQTLRKELDAKNVLKKDFEAQIASLTSSLESKEQALTAEVESHKHTKNLLEQSNNERKKNSVLSLEMQDYERSAKESTKKLEKRQEEITKLNNHIESQKTTINALREQNKLLEERVTTEGQTLSTITSEMNTYKKQISTLENEIAQKIEKIQDLTHLLEASRSETEELSTELSKVIAEHQKNNASLKSDRDQLSNENLRLQQSLREYQDDLKLCKDELKVVQTEYDGYKVRAQSVLRQNQSRDVGLEEKLSEEVSSLVAQNLALTTQIDGSKKKIESLEKDNSKLSTEIVDCTNRSKELEEECEEIKGQFADLSAKYEKTVSENAETLRNLKLHADTLSQCYRQQLADQESRHNKEISELQSRLEKAPSPMETSPVLPTMPRGEGEGSESIESNLSINVHPVPLERLLGTDSDQETDRIKKKLHEHESKVLHLTALLSDTEQDLVKHVQMNKVLKEEIRRQQRSEEREKHAENLEYLKNVVFKFVTLNSGDERTRLVPVLNTILKLSPEETKQLNSVAKGGELSLKGWSNYLPTWTSPNKPQ